MTSITTTIPPHFYSLPNNHTEEILKVGVRDGGEVVWDYMWNLTTNSLLASDTEMYYGALAYTNEQWLIWRYGGVWGWVI